MPSVSAKPRTEPVPKAYSTTAAMMVVTFESMMAESALEKPLRTAEPIGRPFLTSSRMRSKMTTFASTAMPMPRMIPATPGRVSCAPVSASSSTTIIM